MLKRYHQFYGGLFRFSDACVIGVVWIASYWLRFHVPIIAVTKGFPRFSTYASLTPLVMFLWLIIFSILKIYQPSEMLRRTKEAHAILRAHALALIVFIALTYLFIEYRYSRAVMIYFAVLGGMFLVMSRLLFRNALRLLRKRGFKLNTVLAVGEGGSLEHMIYWMERFPELGIRVIGSAVAPDSQTKQVGGKSVLGFYQDLPRIIREQRIQRVLIALPRNQDAALDLILETLRNEMVEIHIVPDIHEYVAVGCQVENFYGVPVVALNDSPLQGWWAIAKRVSDFSLSVLALIILALPMFVIAILIKLTSPGPVFYRQERMGLDGRTFYMLKFRSMRVDAELSTGAVWAQENDPRRTAFGSFLRKTSLDEFPQFLNVLKGDMSLVGPRPERGVFVEKFSQDIPHYMLRHKVKAGITGWAQINGWRGNTSLEKRIEYDLYYIRNWSYLFDLKILILTFWKGFIHKNAY